MLVIVVLASVQSSAQLRVRGYLLKDSAAIGEIVPYILTASYPRDKQVVFPDSTFSVAPFELSGKRFFPTRSLDGASYDSAVYFVSTFEIDSIQVLRLPVFLVTAADSTAVYARPDSLRLRYRVTIPLDSVAVEKLPLKANTAYQRVKWLFNYPVLMMVAVVLAIVSIIAWLVFGKQIRRFFALRRLRKAYENFQQRYTQALETLGSEASSRRAEEALVMWKKYMEELEQFPFTKSTSREILRRYSSDLLASALRNIDRAIYGGYDASHDPFVFLKTYSRQQFEKREAELKNG